MERKKGEKREGRKGRHLAEESKFTKRKVTKVHSKPLAPHPAVLSTDHQLSRRSGAGAGRTHQKEEQRQGMAAGGRMQSGDWVPHWRLGMFGRRKERAPLEGTAKQRAETSTGKNRLGSPEGGGQGHWGHGPEVWMLLMGPK